ncbi:MAG: hypothetical protein EHM87_24715 [Burkholderiales bacterium]|nr:MAG: hypothetical protein EHM87_24715 [Burkholderiales bacterium]
MFKNILYGDTWDFTRFQADKPNIRRSDWWWWVHELPEFEQFRRSFFNATKELTSRIDKKFLIADSNSVSFKTLSTKPFFLMDL